MQIILGAYGFCVGVEKAIKSAKKMTEHGGRLFCTHPIIHNKNVITDLQKYNIYVLNSSDMLNENDSVAISAHGCSFDDYFHLLQKYKKVLDLSCPFVKVIHEKVRDYSQKGYSIIILGEKNHVEIIATANCCNNSQVVKTAEEIDFSVNDKFFVTTQTTFPNDLYVNIIKKIENIAKKLLKTVEFFNGICYTTVKRREETQKIAKKSDIVLVIGDKDSSNCNKLYDLACKFCQRVYIITNISDLKSVQIENKNNAMLGIISSASTPKELTMEVFNRMSELNVTDVIVNDEVKAEPAIEAADATQLDATTEKKDYFSMEEAMKHQSYNAKSIREGQRLKVSVIKADGNGIQVAIQGGSGKNDLGFIANTEAELDGTYDANNYAPGAELNAIIIPKDQGSKDKSINLSKKAYDAIKADDEHVKKILAGDEFTLTCTQEIKGGLLGKIGTYSVFVPASQIRLGFVKNLADYVNKPLRLKALPPKEELDEDGNVKKPRNAKRIVASQKIILEAEKAAREDEFWSKVYEGAIVNGKVKRFTEFGAFVSLKFMDALVRNVDLSWSKKRITDPGEILEKDKNYDFLVLKVERAKDRISLGYKQLQKRPAEIAQEKYPVGSVVKGKVSSIVKFGAFVELEPGIEGLVHISQINRGWVPNAGDALKEGDEVEVKVMEYKDDRITLSIKELLPETVEEESAVVAVEEKTTSRTANFNKRLEAKDSTERREKRPRKVKEDSDDEPREYVSSSSAVTLGDLFKFNINTDDKKD